MVCAVGLAALVATVVALVAEYAVVCATGVVVARATLVAIGRDGAAVAVDAGRTTALAVLALAVTTRAAPYEVAMTTRYANVYSDDFVRRDGACDPLRAFGKLVTIDGFKVRASLRLQQNCRSSPSLCSHHAFEPLFMDFPSSCNVRLSPSVT